MESQHENQIELSFLSWVAASDDRIATLLPQLPHDVFSEHGKKIAQEVLSGESRIREVAPASDAAAMGFLRGQLLGYLGREAARAQRSGSLASVQRAIELLDQCYDGGHPVPLDDFEAIIPRVRHFVATGVEPLDEQILGLARGDLGIIAAPAGRGKSAILINFAVNASMSGYSVLYITVADQGKDELAPRFDTCILEEPMPRGATEMVLAERHKRAAKRLSGRLWLADYTDRECSLIDIERAIRARQADLVIVDHADDVVSPYSGDPTVTRHSLRVVYMALKKFSVKYNVPIWTASQASEFSWTMPAAGITELAEAKTGKATGAAIVLGISGGSREMASDGIVYATIAKARRAFTERIVPLRVDFQINRVW